MARAAVADAGNVRQAPSPPPTGDNEAVQRLVRVGLGRRRSSIVLSQRERGIEDQRQAETRAALGEQCGRLDRWPARPGSSAYQRSHRCTACRDTPNQSLTQVLIPICHAGPDTGHDCAGLLAGLLGEFGDDPDRYRDARGRKNYAGTSPITEGVRNPLRGAGPVRPQPPTRRRPDHPVRVRYAPARMTTSAPSVAMTAASTRLGTVECVRWARMPAPR
jgi:hypothetical protein